MSKKQTRNTNFSLHSAARNINTLNYFLYNQLENLQWIKTTKKIEYLNTPISFDIETTSTYINDEKVAFMYEFTLGFNGYAFIGREWSEFHSALDLLVKAFKLTPQRRIIIYVQNLAFEFGFISRRFVWDRVFALKERTPIQCIDIRGVEFRCSYALSGYSLAKMGENLIKYKVHKMVGDLDYSKIRHSHTPMTDKEIGYCVNDVLIVMAYIQEKIESDGDITRIPLTKTGYVRKYCRRRCYYSNTNHKADEKYREYRALMDELTLTPDEYAIAKRAFHGGFTHANAFYSGVTVKDVDSYDFTSSYPFVMCSEKFPMSKGVKINNITEREFIMYCSTDCCVFDVEFFDIEATIHYENIISVHKCTKVVKGIENNGRISKADYIKISLTNIDFENIFRFYKWSKMRVSNFWRYRKKYLPKDLILSVLDLYENKTRLKGVKGKEVEYASSKEMVNAMFGMCVTDICKDEITFTEEGWSKEAQSISVMIDKYNHSRNRFLSYMWGIFITAYAQKNLFSGILEWKDDYIYSDTDSLKGKNGHKHRKYIEEYNNKATHKLEKMCEHYSIPFEKTCPKTIKGETKPLGVWDYEGTYTRFKTIGAKRYMVEKDNEISLTVAGVNKSNAIPYLRTKYGASIFEHFNDELYIPATIGESTIFNSEGIAINNPTGKSTHTYIEKHIRGDVIDYRGVKGEFDELTAVHLEASDYSFSITDAYADFIKGVQERFK